jgi:hypothetical protein
MKCPHCSIGVSVDWEETDVFIDPGDQTSGYTFVYGTCPECSMPIAQVRHGKISDSEHDLLLGFPVEETVVFPQSYVRPVDPEVPESFRGDYQEAASVLSLSPNASAALSRRLLQRVLRDEIGVKPSSLAVEIREFINTPGVPSHLSDAVDAVRNVGNFAAHPLKDTDTGQIADVEAGEADWLLDVLEALFDFAFIQPKRLEGRKARLNAKLKSLGKPPLKDA